MLPILIKVPSNATSDLIPVNGLVDDDVIVLLDDDGIVLVEE